MLKQWNLAEKQWTSDGVLLVDPFLIKELHKFVQIYFPAWNKTSKKMTIFKKIPFRRPKRWNLANKRRTSYEVLLVDPSPVENLHKFVWIYILAQNKMSTETKIFEENVISKVERMEFGREMMNFLRSLARWPIPIKKLHKFTHIWILV